MSEAELTRLFERLGARDPGGWAQSQIGEGIPQLARYLFLRQAWASVLADDDAWIATGLKTSADGPGGDLPRALSAVLARGAAPGDITAIVRIMQWRLLFSICHLLDDPGEIEAEASGMCWSLFQTDSAGRPIAAIGGLHESVLETDPTGREMRAKGSDVPPEMKP